MKIKFIGTGSAISRQRNTQSILIKSEDKSILFDVGGGNSLLKALEKSELDDINDIFLTHLHADHVSGIIPFLIDRCQRPIHTTLYSHSSTLETIKKLIDLYGYDFIYNFLSMKLKFRSIQSEQSVSVNALEIVPLEVVKTDKRVDFAYKIISDDKKIVISGDTLYNESLIKFSKGADILIHEVFDLHYNAKLAHEYGHTTAKEVGIIASKANVNQLCLTHISPDIENKLDKVIQEVSEEFSKKTIIAEDGLVLNI
jgi:ribonuclease Z